MPQQFVSLIANIYSQRQFVVVAADSESARCGQHAEMSQGCPLSPFLFVMMMSVIMHDSIHALPSEDRESLKLNNLANVLYADDTLLVGSSQTALKRWLAAVAETGGHYGLLLHCGKFQLLNVRCDFSFLTPEGTTIAKTESIGYLGETLNENGKISSELGRRLGIVWADCRNLQQLCNRVSIPLQKRV